MPFNQNLHLDKGIVCLDIRYALNELHVTLVKQSEGLMPQRLNQQSEALFG
jgi:hypothetical protein